MIEPIGYRKKLKGKSEAQLITFNDGQDYVVKCFQKGIEKTLPNEWVSYCLARYLHLPIPYAKIVEIPQEFISKYPELKNMENTKYQFASMYVPNCYNLHQVPTVTNIINDDSIANILVFDYWLYNKDRTRDNILLCEEIPNSCKLWIIDHGVAFGSFKWDISDLGNLPVKIMKSATHKYLAKFVLDEKDFFEAIDTIQKIPIHLLEEIVELIPDEWLESEEEKKAIVCTLVNRREKILPKLVRKFIRKVYHPLHQSNS